MSNSHSFCRKLVAETQKNLTIQQRTELAESSVFVERTAVGCDKVGEFFAKSPVTGERFYWYGSVCCAYDARDQGLNAWFKEFYPEADGNTPS